MSNNVTSAENQQATFRISGRESSETIRQAPLTRSEVLAYLQGALHDASLNKGRRVRFVQKYREWLETLKTLLKSIKYNSWIYKEGRHRNLYALETICNELSFTFDPETLQTKREKTLYLRGFFDAEGGVPRNCGKFYVQLVQKNYEKMVKIKKLLDDLGIRSGKIHNPSRAVDPDYWRIFVSMKDHGLFAQRIGSWHPVKSKILSERMKI